MLFRNGVLFFLSLLTFSFAFADVRVKGYTRKDGTYVPPHYRSNPDGKFNNNWSTSGNINPYTGEYGTKMFNPNKEKIYTPSTIKDLNVPYTPTYPSIPSQIKQHLSSANASLKKPAHTSDNYPVQNSEHKISSKNVPTLEKIEQESKIRSSDRLKSLGYSGDTSKLSNMEMLELESKIRSSNRLKNLSYVGDTSKLSNMEMLELESRIRSSNRLKSLGYSSDTSKLSNIEMLEIETKLLTHQRLKNLNY